MQNTNPTGAITNAFAFVAQSPVKTGPINNSFAFYAEDPNSVNFFAGPLAISTSSSAPAPGAKLEVNGNISIDTPGNGVIFPDSTVQITALPNGCSTNQIPKWSGTA